MDNKQLTTVMGRAQRLCQARGARLTARRRTVLELICKAERPLSAYEILDRMRTPATSPAPPTVYRALDFLLEQGLVHRLESLHAFIRCSHPEHPHCGKFLICSECGRVCEIKDKALEQSLQAVEKAAGFKTQRPVVELLGTCAQCAGKGHAGV